MSKVNHKLVKKRLNEQRSKITDRQFFSSRLLAGHFEDMAAAQTRRYHYNRRVHVSLYWKPRDEHAASTDNLFIRINTGHPLVTKVRGRENRYQVICGMFAHELGHVLHTDFLAEQTRMNYFASNIWYPHPPELKTAADARREKAFWDYVKSGPQNLSMAQMVAHHISNVIEDGYIENRMLMDFPGTLGYGLEKFRERHYEMISTVTQLIEEEEDGKQHIFESILQILLSYAKFGEIKYGDEPLSDERIQAVFSLISDVDGALLNSSGKERLGAANMILVRCWDYIEGFCEACRRRQEAAAAAGGTEDIGEIMSKLLRSVPGSTGIGEGNHSPVAETAGHVVLSATAAARARTRTLAAVSESAEKTNLSRKLKMMRPEQKARKIPRMGQKVKTARKMPRMTRKMRIFWRNRKMRRKRRKPADRVWRRGRPCHLGRICLWRAVPCPEQEKQRFPNRSRAGSLTIRRRRPLTQQAGK